MAAHVADRSFSPTCPPRAQNLFDIPDDDKAASLVAADAEYCRRRAGPAGEPPHLRYRIVHAVRRDFLVGSAFKAIYVGQQLASPMVLRLLVGSIAQDKTIGVVYAVVLVGPASPLPTVSLKQARAVTDTQPLWASGDVT